MGDQQQQQSVIHPVMPDDLNRLMAGVKGRDAASGAAATTKSAVELFPFAARLQGKKEAREKEISDLLSGRSYSSALIGQEIEGQGVFVGRYTPVDSEGNSLCGTFNVFAAPYDLTDEASGKKLFKYPEAMERIAGLKNWNGFDGTHYEDDKKIYQALKDGSYKGGWIIPMVELLGGKYVHNDKFQYDNIFAHRNKGALQGTFTTVVKMDSRGRPDHFSTHYLSSTCGEGEYLDLVTSVNFKDGHESWGFKGNEAMSCRPLRLVPVPQAQGGLQS